MITKKEFIAIGIGEILWDVLPDSKKLGGAPTNFAFHAKQLGVQSAIISAVGNDPLGDEIHDIVNRTNLVNLIQSNEKPTGTVSVTLSDNGIPTYIIHENVAWDFVNTTREAKTFAENADAICFGSLAQRSEMTKKTIQNILRTSSAKAIKVFDINIRQNFYDKEIIENSLQLANVLKINEEEIVLFTEMFGISGDEFEIVNQILGAFNLDYLALTKGSQGSWLISSNDQSFISTPETRVVDTVGAGDSFTAAMVAGLLHGLPLKEAHQLAVDVSAFVCTQEGATPALPDHLKSRIIN